MAAKKKELVTLDEAVQFLNEHHNMQGRDYLARRTLSNYIANKRLTNYGHRRLALVDKKELLERVCKT